MSSLSQFLLDFTKGRYELPDTITRARRLVQARYPETRGNKYLERTTTKEQRVRADMRKEKVNDLFSALGDIMNPRPAHKD